MNRDKNDPMSADDEESIIYDPNTEIEEDDEAINPTIERKPTAEEVAEFEKEGGRERG